MKLLFLAAIVFMFPLVGSAHAAGPCGSASVDVRNAYGKDNDLKDFSQGELVIYVIGFANGIIGSEMANSSKKCVDKLHECIAHKGSARLGEILQRYIADHPEELQLPASILTFKAIFLPCRS